MQPVSIDVKCLNLWQNHIITVMGAYSRFHIAFWGWLPNFFVLPFSKIGMSLTLTSTNYDAFASTSVFPLLKHTQMLLSMQFRLLASISFMPYLVLRERKNEKKTWQTENKHIHVQSNVHHIFKHISKSSDFEIISQNKYIFFFSTH